MRGTGTGVINVTSTESAFMQDTYASNTYARDSYTANTFIAIDTYIKGAGPNGINIEDVNTKNAYSGGVRAVKHSKTNLQYFSVSKVKLFDMS